MRIKLYTNCHNTLYINKLKLCTSKVYRQLGRNIILNRTQMTHLHHPILGVINSLLNLCGINNLIVYGSGWTGPESCLDIIKSGSVRRNILL